MAKTRKGKQDYMQDAIELGLGIGGGVVGNFATTWLEKQAFMGKAAPYSATAISALGALGYVLSKDAKIKSFAFGLCVIGGTETAETVMAKTGVMAGLGLTEQQLGLGFTGKELPTDAVSTYVDGVAVR